MIHPCNHAHLYHLYPERPAGRGMVQLSCRERSSIQRAPDPSLSANNQAKLPQNETKHGHLTMLTTTSRPPGDAASLACNPPRMPLATPLSPASDIPYGPGQEKTPIDSRIYMCILPCRLCNAFSLLPCPSFSSPQPLFPMFHADILQPRPLPFLDSLPTLQRREPESNLSSTTPHPTVSSLFRRAAAAGYQVMGIKINQTNPGSTILLPMSWTRCRACLRSNARVRAGSFLIRLVSRPCVLNVHESYGHRGGAGFHQRTWPAALENTAGIRIFSRRLARQ